MDIDTLLEAYEARLSEDEELLETAQTELVELDERIAQLERSTMQADGLAPDTVHACLATLREQRRKTAELIETLEHRNTETRARYEHLQELLEEMSH